VRRKLYPNLAYSWLARFSPDLTIISQCGNADGLPWIEACAKMRIPYAAICHAAAECFWPTDTIAERFRILCNRALGFYFVSHANLQLTSIQFATQFCNAKVVRNPFQVAYDTNPPWPQGDLMQLACVARLEPLCRGQDILFRMLAADKWRARPFHVTLYGEGYNADNLRRLKEMWRLDSITFGGTLRPEEIWAKHHALVLPSRIEGLPIAIVEAMLCGRPCIVTDIAGQFGGGRRWCYWICSGSAAG
jgi:glycosyltransferase involved in cell wall biosynthesis